MFRNTILMASLALCTSTYANGQISKEGRAGKMAFAAFQCSIYAEAAGYKNEQARLFNLGKKSGHEFFDAVNKGQVTKEAFFREVPAALKELLDVPTAEFFVGRLFEYARKEPRYQLDSVQKELRHLRASSRFSDSNCSLLQ